MGGGVEAHGRDARERKTAAKTESAVISGSSDASPLSYLNGRRAFSFSFLLHLCLRFSTPHPIYIHIRGENAGV